MNLKRVSRLVPLHVAVVLFAAAFPVLAQRAFTAADYARAEAKLPYYTAPLVDHAVERVTWTSSSGEAPASDRFWYRDTANGATTFMLVDAKRRTKVPAFDQAQMAAALESAGVSNSTPNSLPITGLEFSDAGATLVVSARGVQYRCVVSGPYSCKKQSVAAPVRPGLDLLAVSPDRKRAVFIRYWNLWVRDMSTGAEKQLTTDGMADYGYATDNSGWTHSERAIVVWSPDSKMVATFQQDQRRTGMMYTVSTNVGHPRLDAWRFPLAGDKDVTMIERVVIDTETGKVTRLKMPPDQHRSSLCDELSCHGTGWADVQWARDGKTLAFVSTSRDHKREDLRMADVSTGEVRNVMHEEVPTFFESGNGRVNWRYLSTRNEILWFSERSNWGHLYLYDAANGKLKHSVTSGDWNVTELLTVEEKTGQLVFQGVGREGGVNGREKGWDPYYSAVYSGNLDGKGVKLLTPEPANHTATPSEDGQYLVDIYSTPQTPPIAVLRDDHGKRILEIATADVTRLKATGWLPPASFTVKGRDGKTDLYGVMYKPSNFNSQQKYPVVNYIYPGPQTGSVGSRSFSSLLRSSDNAALAELGFIVVAIDGMGTPWRSKHFHEAYFGNMGDNTLPDQVAGMKQLAAENPWIDLTRAGIWGHSGGGYAAADAMFRYPYFFKVGWSESGNHENRNGEDDWAEKWIGLLDATNKQAYEEQSNIPLAKSLKGKLMLVHGTMDDNTPAGNTLLLVDALMKAGKDFDLLMVPNASHGYGANGLYIVRRRWDYFVQNLMGATPPSEYKLNPPLVR